MPQEKIISTKYLEAQEKYNNLTENPGKALFREKESTNAFSVGKQPKVKTGLKITVVTKLSETKLQS